MSSCESTQKTSRSCNLLYFISIFEKFVCSSKKIENSSESASETKRAFWFIVETFRLLMDLFHPHYPGGGGQLPYMLVRDVQFFGMPFTEHKINFGVYFW